jgi:hypothetical protein
MSLKQWNRIPGDERDQLVARPCGTPPETAAYKEFLSALIAAHTHSAVEFCALEGSPPWSQAHAVPERIREWAQGLGVAAPSAEQWAHLTPLQRFALFKLTRPGHSNENFLPAMREFQLLR